VQISLVDARIASLAYNDDRVRLLMTMPGLDYFSASCCGDLRYQISSDKRLVSWAGLAPSVHQSGERTAFGRVGRYGNRLVRWVLVEAAQAAVRSDERFRMLYERYASRKGCQKSVVAVAHEMLRIVYYMLKRSEPYRGENRRLSMRKLKRLERRALSGLQV